MEEVSSGRARETETQMLVTDPPLRVPSVGWESRANGVYSVSQVKTPPAIWTSHTRLA